MNNRSNSVFIIQFFLSFSISFLIKFVETISEMNTFVLRFYSTDSLKIEVSLFYNLGVNSLTGIPEIIN